MGFKLELRGIKKSFLLETGCKQVLGGITANFLQGATYAITGASGSGKSTLLHVMAGLDVPTGGTVLVGNTDLRHCTGAQRAGMVALVTQTPFLIKELTVLENIQLAGLILSLPEREARERALFYLAAVGLFETQQWNVGALSGGQRQRVCIARALLVQPRFLCADEPTGALDEKTGDLIIDLLLSHQKQDGMGLIVSSHNPRIIEKMEVVFDLKDGILVPRHTVLHNEVVHERITA